jgi:tetratricopeptide (TPR) repeat protein
MRDAAYDAMPKADRATKHEVLARFLEARPDHVRGSAEVLGFHLEQAHRYRVELGEAGDNVRELAVEASDRLGAAGLRAYARDDVHGAVALLERSASLAGVGSATRLKLLPDLAEAVRESGDYAHAEALVAETIDGAGRAGDLPLEEYARLIRLRMRVQTDPSLGADDLIAGARRALDVFGPDDDARSLAKAWELLAWGQWLKCHAGATEEALAHSLEHARRAADGRTIAQSLHLTLGAAVFGPRSVPDAIARCEEILEDGAGQKRVAGSALRALAALKAMAGDFDEARLLLGRFSSIVDDIGLRVTAASAAETYAEVELRAGNAHAAEQRLRPAYDQLAAMGESSTSANLAALLAQALHAQGRPAQALAVADVVAAKDDVSACVHLLIARSLALAAVGSDDIEAERLARGAVARAQETDFLAMRADSLRGLAEVVGRQGRAGEAKRLLGRALELYRQKQLTVAIAQTEELLAGPCIPPEGGLS